MNPAVYAVDARTLTVELPMPLSPELERLLSEALTREHRGPPRLPHWTFGPLLHGCRQLFADPERGWSWSPSRAPLIASNAASWMVWQLGGEGRGVAALTLHGERMDREHGVEAALRAASTLAEKLARTGADPNPLDALAGRRPLGADNLSSLHRRQLQWELLRLRHAAGRLSSRPLETLCENELDHLAASDPEPAAAPDAPPEEGSATLPVWAAAAWFWERWERVDEPSFLWWLNDWFRGVFGGARGGERPPHGGPAEANWRREAQLQVRFRAAFCLGLGVWLERRLQALDPALLAEDLGGPDRAPPRLRARVAALLEEEVVPVALALLEDRAFSLPGLEPDARRALRRVLGQRSDGSLYRVDSQLGKLPGQDNEAREHHLYTLARALGQAVVAARLASPPSTDLRPEGDAMNGDAPGCGHGPERARLRAGPLRTAEDLRALSSLVEGCPDCRAWWLEQSQTEVLSWETARLAAARKVRERPARRPALLLVPAALAAGLLLTLLPDAGEPELTTLAGEVAVAGVVTVQETGGGVVQHPVREQDAELRLVAPAESWVSFGATAVRLPDAANSEATLMAWAAGSGRLDLVLRERLTRAADGVASRAPAQEPLAVTVGEGVELVVVVLPGEVGAIPDTVSARSPLSGLPERALVHHIRVIPGP